MTIQSSTEQLSGLISQFETQRERILTNKNLTQEGKNNGVNTLRTDYVSRVSAVLVTLWGDILDTGDGGRMLNEAAEIWRELAAAERGLNEAKNTAERAGVDPAFIVLARDRANSLVKMARTPDDLKKFYDEASADVKLVLQESLPTLLGERYGNVAWTGVTVHVEADRKRRLMTPQVEAANNRLNQVMDNAVAAYNLTKKVADLFGHYDGYVQTLLSHVDYRYSLTTPNAEYPEGATNRRMERRRSGFIPTGPNSGYFTSPNVFGVQ